jgi:outer membrane lipoprotein-sorting protein
MNKKVSIFGIISILTILVISLLGCSKGSTTTPQITTSPTPTATTSTPTSGGILGDILGKVSGIASMKYDMTTTTSGSPTMTWTVWAKKNKMRMEGTQQGQNVVMLMNGDTKTMYMYTPAQNTAIKMDFSQAPKSATDNSNGILKYTPTIVGTETIDGKVCQVIQFNADNVTSKEWIWEAKGLPVRIQSTTSQGTSTTDFKNYDFADVSDSMFELPAGVQITTIGLPTGLPTNLPTGLPTNLPTGLPTKLP